MINNKFLLLLTATIFLLLTCPSLWAQEQCEPNYPDQMEFDDCAGVTQLSWEDFPQEQVSSDSATSISISGGRAPFTLSVSGSGFYFDSDGTQTQTVETTTSNTTIYAINACGSATVSVTDGCSTANGQVASTNGVWTEVYSSAMGVDGDDQGHDAYSGGCPAVFGAVSPADSYNADTFEDQTAAWKVRQIFYRRANRQYTLNPSYDSIMTTCGNLGDLCGNRNPLELSGSCFTFERSADCEDSGIGDGRYLSYDLGNQKSVYKPTGYWYLEAGCSYISGTKIWKWQCQN